MQSVASGMGGMEMESSVIEGRIDKWIDKWIAGLVAFPKLDSRVESYTLEDPVPFEK